MFSCLSLSDISSSILMLGLMPAATPCGQESQQICPKQSRLSLACWQLDSSDCSTLNVSPTIQLKIFKLISFMRVSVIGLQLLKRYCTVLDSWWAVKGFMTAIGGQLQNQAIHCLRFQTGGYWNMQQFLRQPLLLIISKSRECLCNTPTRFQSIHNSAFKR